MNQIGKDHYIKFAKDTIRGRFGVEIEVELVSPEACMRRKAELAMQYGIKTDGLKGFFTPGKTGLPPMMFVEYCVNGTDFFAFVEEFYHELQHALDFFEAKITLGKAVYETFEKYFGYYTEFNASLRGYASYMQEYLRTTNTAEEILDFKSGSKMCCARIFNLKQHKTIMDVLVYLARILAIAQVEGVPMDCAQLTTVPCLPRFVNLINWIGQYAPTPEWYAEFREKIDGIESGAVKEADV